MSGSIAAQRGRPVLIVGGSGQIGGCLMRACARKGWPVVATYCHRPIASAVSLEALDRGRVKALIQNVRPWLVINSLNAKGGTDACEVEPGLAERAHFETARNLADAAQEVGARCIQISTDYVFDGRRGPYSEEDTPAPLSRLGHAKLRAEQYMRQRNSMNLVVRTSFVFSWTPESSTKNFVMQLMDSDRAGHGMRVPTDQVGNVTYAPNFAEALVELVSCGATGLYHVAGTTRCSKFEWALRAAERFGLDTARIRGVSTAELRQAGLRPLQSGFRLDKAQAALARTRLMSLEEGLTAMESEMAMTKEMV